MTLPEIENEFKELSHGVSIKESIELSDDEYRAYLHTTQGEIPADMMESDGVSAAYMADALAEIADSVRLVGTSIESVVSNIVGKDEPVIEGDANGNS